MFFIPLLVIFGLSQPLTDIECNYLNTGNHSEHVLLPMLIYFTSDHCTSCAEYDALFEQAEILQLMEKKYVPVRVSIDHRDGKVCADIYDVTYIPAFVIADHKGIILYKSDESLSVKEIQELLDAIPGQFPDVKPSNETQPVASDVENTIQVLSEENVVLPAVAINNPTLISEVSESPTLIAVRETRTSDPAQHIPGNVAEAPAQEEIKASPSNAMNTNVKPAVKENVSSKPAVTTTKNTSSTLRTYSIQLGYFSEELNAQKLEAKAVQKGLSETRTQKEMHNGVAYFRVLLGHCNSLSEAQKILDRVHALGLKGAVYRL